MWNQFPIDTFFAWGVHSLNLSQTFQFSLYKCKSGYFKCMHHTERMVEWMLSSSRSAAENIFCFISCLQAVMSQCSVRILPGAKICRVQARTECKIRLWTGTRYCRGVDSSKTTLVAAHLSPPDVTWSLLFQSVAAARRSNKSPCGSLLLLAHQQLISMSHFLQQREPLCHGETLYQPGNLWTP